jgi:8-oxo-dGTP diphosphatase
MIQVTCALIIRDGKVLITQNGDNSDHPFKWEFPGGKRIEGESRKQCILREIEEELELKIEIIEVMFPVEHDYGTKTIKLIPFVCSIKSGKLKLNNHLAKKWIGFNQIFEIDFLEADKKLLSLDKNREILKKHTRK